MGLLPGLSRIPRRGRPGLAFAQAMLQGSDLPPRPHLGVLQGFLQGSDLRAPTPPTFAGSGFAPFAKAQVRASVF